MALASVPISRSQPMGVRPNPDVLPPVVTILPQRSVGPYSTRSAVTAGSRGSFSTIHDPDRRIRTLPHSG